MVLLTVDTYRMESRPARDESSQASRDAKRPRASPRIEDANPLGRVLHSRRILCGVKAGPETPLPGVFSGLGPKQHQSATERLRRSAREGCGTAATRLDVALRYELSWVPA